MRQELERRNAVLLISIACAVGVLGACRYQAAGDPALLVSEFYGSYPHHLHGGLPRDAEMEWLRGFLSKRLLSEFSEARAYQSEWIRRNPDPPREPGRVPVILKPPFACGVHFTGVEDAGATFRVGVAERQSPGVWNVPIHFWLDPTLEGWGAIVRVTTENHGYVIDDIEFLESEPGRKSWTITQALRSRGE